MDGGWVAENLCCSLGRGSWGGEWWCSSEGVSVSVAEVVGGGRGVSITSSTTRDFSIIDGKFWAIFTTS